MIWSLIGLVFLLLILGAFVIISRRGRALRKSQPLPPSVHHAYIQWSEQGTENEREVTTPFYFGKSTESNVILPAARANFEVCIFYHNQRFAIQALNGAGELLINDEEAIAGYLRDGDLLKVARQEFLFRCY